MKFFKKIKSELPPKSSISQYKIIILFIKTLKVLCFV